MQTVCLSSGAYQNRSAIIDTPAKYLERKGLYGTFYTKGEPLWTDYKVSSILNNEMYTGTFVYGKYRVKVVGAKQKRLLPSNEWKRIPNHHEAIVTIEEYEQVQSMKGTVPALFTPAGRRASVYTGRVVCDCCGRNMVYKKDRVGKMLFQCNVNYRKKNNCAHRILVTDLDTIIKGELVKEYYEAAKLEELYYHMHENNIIGMEGYYDYSNIALLWHTYRECQLEFAFAYDGYLKNGKYSKWQLESCVDSGYDVLTGYISYSYDENLSPKNRELIKPYQEKVYMMFTGVLQIPEEMLVDLEPNDFEKLDALQEYVLEVLPNE